VNNGCLLFIEESTAPSIQLGNTYSTARKSAISDSTDNEAQPEQLPAGSLFNDHYLTGDQL
jgi:hypothetical protein